MTIQLSHTVRFALRLNCIPYRKWRLLDFFSALYCAAEDATAEALSLEATAPDAEPATENALLLTISIQIDEQTTEELQVFANDTVRSQTYC